MNVRYEKFDVGLYVNLITKNMTSIEWYYLWILIVVYVLDEILVLEGNF